MLMNGLSVWRFGLDTITLEYVYEADRDIYIPYYIWKYLKKFWAKYTDDYYIIIEI